MGNKNNQILYCSSALFEKEVLIVFLQFDFFDFGFDSLNMV